MNIQYLSQCAFLDPTGVNSKWLPGILTQIGTSSTYYILNPDGTIASIQPDGSVSTRPAGTTPASYETFTPDAVNNTLHVNPGVPYLLVYRGQ